MELHAVAQKAELAFIEPCQFEFPPCNVQAEVMAKLYHKRARSSIIQNTNKTAVNPGFPRVWCQAGGTNLLFGIILPKTAWLKWKNWGEIDKYFNPECLTFLMFLAPLDPPLQKMSVWSWKERIQYEM